jgi:oxygen-independent coproporphyrinogen-3 oxidase
VPVVLVICSLMQVKGMVASRRHNEILQILMNQMSLVDFDAGLIKRYDVPGPRYTSYPTALQFGEFSDQDFRQAVQDSPYRHRDLSLYVHLPFCATLCYYCACNKIVTRKREPLEQYLNDLESEIALLSGYFEGRQVSQLHWGGGTPTFLDDDQVSWLYGRLREAFDFRPDAEGEFSIEIDPRTVDAGRIVNLREAGFNRLSFGIQDFEPAVQAAVNRRQSFEETQNVINAARDCGFSSISVDLIYGLPHQTLHTFTETLAKVSRLGPDRVSIYNYAHLPDRFSPQKRILATDLPDPDEKLKILERCVDFLTDAGYIYIGMDHFALPDDELAIALREGTLQRNFQGYSTYADCDLLALGVTGISHIGNTYCQNEKDIEAYSTRLSEGQLPLLQGVVIDHDDQIRKEVIRQLMCHFELSYADIDHRFGVDTANYFREELERLSTFQADGLIEPDDHGFRVTPRGRFLIRNIVMVFDRYLKQPQLSERFSKAI